MIRVVVVAIASILVFATPATSQDAARPGEIGLWSDNWRCFYADDESRLFGNIWLSQSMADFAKAYPRWPSVFAFAEDFDPGDFYALIAEHLVAMSSQMRKNKPGLILSLAFLKAADVGVRVIRLEREMFGRVRCSRAALSMAYVAWELFHQFPADT